MSDRAQATAILESIVNRLRVQDPAETIDPYLAMPGAIICIFCRQEQAQGHRQDCPAGDIQSWWRLQYFGGHPPGGDSDLWD